MGASKNWASRVFPSKSFPLRMDFHLSATSSKGVKVLTKTLWCMVILISSHMELDGMKTSAQLSQSSRKIVCTEEVEVMMVMPHSLACQLSKLPKSKVLKCQESAWSLRLRRNLEAQTLSNSFKSLRTQSVYQMLCSAWTLELLITTNYGSPALSEVFASLI